MKIFYITNVRLPTEKAHGLQIMKMCEAFAQNGCDVTLIAPRLPTIADDPFAYYSVKKNFTLRQIWTFRSKSYYLQGLVFTFHALLRFRVHGGILYSRDFITLFLGALFGCRPVAEVHDYRSTRPQWQYRFMFRRCRAMVVNSEGTKKAIQDHYGISESKIFVAPNAVDPVFFDRSPLPHDGIAVGYVGNLETLGHEKGIDTLLEAFSFLKDRNKTFLHIVGGPDYLIKKYGRHDRVVFTGHIPFRDIPEYLRKLDILVIPFPRVRQFMVTASPIKVLEFMAAGKIIVASDMPSLRVHLHDANAYFFEPENISDLTRVLEMILSDMPTARRKALRAKSDAQQHTWTARAEHILQFIHA